MQAILKNINYGTITAGGDVHIGDKIYIVERDFPHSILFLRIEKAGEEYEAMLSVKGPDDASVPLLREKVRLPIDGDLFEQVEIFQDHRRGAGEALRLGRGLVTTPQTLEISLPTAIYQSFFVGEIGLVCTDFLSLLQSGKIRDLLLVVSTEEEAVQNLPWEMVLPLLTSVGSNALPRDNFGLVRSREKTVQAFNRQGPTAEAAPIKLLFIPALPENLSERSKMLEIEEEQKKIIDAVRRLEATGNERPKLVMEILDCANLDEIKAALAARSHDIVHISGHGQFVETDKKGILMMENEDGDQQEVAGYELGLALRAFSSIKLVVLSACETAVGGSEGSTAEQTAAVGVPAVLAMRFSVTDAGARLFTEKLYERLAYGDSLTKAMHDARLGLWQEAQHRRANAPQADIPGEWFTPVLYQNQVIGPLTKPEQYNVDTLNRFYPKPDFLRNKYTRLIGEGFIGRKRLLIQLRQHLRQGRHVCLHGLGGLGKTTTAEAFAHHYRQRYGYEVLLFSRGANIQEAVILEKIFSRWKSRAQPAEDVAAELKALLDSPHTEPEQKLQLLLDNCLTGRRTIIILDNFEDVQTDADGAQQQAIVSENLREFIRYLLQNSPSDCHVLFTTRYAITGLDGLVTDIEIDKLTYAEQYRYLNFSPTLRQIPLAERDLLHRRFDGHPRAMQFLEGLLTKHPATDLPTLVQQAEGQIFENLLLGRIYDRLTAHEREVFTVASVFSSRSSLTALSAVLPIESVALAPVLEALRDWSLCFWDETAKVFEVHALTREWMRKQDQPTLDRFKTVSHQLGVFYHEQSTWENDTLAKGYFEQAEAWEEYATIAF
ncbi:CHAT domain-containing protein, partial [Persicitalea sp.]|uniref:CHAT domain-containing protein n=1 Tax=Persicitalea sp. TaxID=3100273 RepID=UPI003593FB0A